MGYMDRLPTVISCCFCCFLRAGTIMIAIFSFIVGLTFAPNVNQTKGFWDMEVILSSYSNVTESAIQLVLGLVSIMLCIVSFLLLIGACCNLPILIEIYQWGAVIYSGTVMVLFFILIVLCFFVHTNCYLAGGLLCVLMVLDVLFSMYFIIVTNSLRVSLKFLASDDFSSMV